MEIESLAVKILAEELFDKRHLFSRTCVNIHNTSDRWRDVAIASIAEVLLDLPLRTIVILYLRLCQGWTLVKIAKGFGISRERVRQIEANGLRKFRHPSRQQAIIRMMRKAVDSSCKNTRTYQTAPPFLANR